MVNVAEDEAVMQNTSTEIQCRENSLEFARFLIGFKRSLDNKYLRIYWKLLQKHCYLYFGDTFFVAEICNSNGTSYRKIEV